MPYTIDSRANITLPKGIEAYYGKNGDPEKVYLLLFCTNCLILGKENGGRFAALRPNISTPETLANDIADLHIQTHKQLVQTKL